MRAVAETPIFQRYAADIWKSKFDNLPTSFIAELKRAVEKSL